MKGFNCRPTVFSGVLLIAFIALFIKFFLLPANQIAGEFNTYSTMGGVEHSTPFWPQYWRRLRNIPEPDDPANIIRSDDGGLILMAVIALPVALALAYKFRKFLIRRV